MRCLQVEEDAAIFEQSGALILREKILERLREFRRRQF